MSTVLANRVGDAPATKKGDDPEGAPTHYESRAVERRIMILRSDEERLFGPLSYGGAQAEMLRRAADARAPLSEAPRPLQ